MKPSLQLRQSQQLTMTPQLQQAIRLLQLPILDLQTQIQEALDENVMLEVDETASLEATEETAEGADDSAEADVSDGDWTDIQRTGPSDTPISYEPRDQPEYADLSEDTLKDHLIWQLELEILYPRTTAIGQSIV
ncbi:MAG: RNA polymerase factor sigma-54, partial [Gammaproteobacteria bacterium]|nr:RNA polymerase factor sigma-54 [Gammaproteobacteria bacterium]